MWSRRTGGGRDASAPRRSVIRRGVVLPARDPPGEARHRAVLCTGVVAAWRSADPRAHLRRVDPIMTAFVSESADVAGSAVVGAGSRIWHLAQIGDQAVLGASCVVGRGAYVGPGVR